MANELTESGSLIADAAMSAALAVSNVENSKTWTVPQWALSSSSQETLGGDAAKNQCSICLEEFGAAWIY